MSKLEIRRIASTADFAAAIPVMRQLRASIDEATFMEDIRDQEKQTYELYGAFSGPILLGLAGVRRQRTLSRGWHMFVDDLVISEDARGRGVGRALMDYVFDLARIEGFKAVYLDSRNTARGFYEALGFSFHTSLPCFKEV